MIVGQYEFHEPPDALLARIGTIHAGDKLAEKRRTQWGCGCGLIVLMLFGAGMIFENVKDDEWPQFWGFVAVMVVLAIVAASRMAKYAKRDLDNRKIDTLQRLVKVLRADLPTDRPVRLRVDFREYVDGGKKLSEAGSWNTVKSAAYTHEWLRLRAALADGTVADLVLSEDVKRKEKPKRKRNKVKERINGEVTVALRLARRYGDAATAAERLRALPPPAGCTLSSVQGQGRRLHATLRTAPYVKVSSRRVNTEDGKLPDADALLMALRWAYRGLKI